jgi:hypothetical protein
MSVRLAPLLLLFMAAWSQAAVTPALGKAEADALKRDTARCNKHDVDACYDAIRWSPSDPALLMALGDALLRAQRPADAIRYYRRAGALAPNLRGLSAKISAAEAKFAAMSQTASKRYSNAAPETQSH